MRLVCNHPITAILSTSGTPAISVWPRRVRHVSARRFAMQYAYIPAPKLLGCCPTVSPRGSSASKSAVFGLRTCGRSQTAGNLSRRNLRVTVSITATLCRRTILCGRRFWLGGDASDTRGFDRHFFVVAGSSGARRVPADSRFPSHHHWGQSRDPDRGRLVEIGTTKRKGIRISAGAMDSVILVEAEMGVSAIQERSRCCLANVA